MFGDYKVQIIERPGTFSNRIYLYKVIPGHGTEYITYKAEVQILKRGEAVKDDELYFAEMTPDQLQAFAEALANKGIKTTQDSVAQGKLQATEKHLEDMRLITFKKLGLSEHKGMKEGEK